MSQCHAFSVGEERKHSAHTDTCREVGGFFVPLLVETIGGWSEKASNTITSIGRFIDQCLGSNSEETMRHLFQRLLISLWKGNSAMWLARSPPPLLLLMVSYNNNNNNNYYYYYYYYRFSERK